MGQPAKISTSHKGNKISKRRMTQSRTATKLQYFLDLETVAPEDFTSNPGTRIPSLHNKEPACDHEIYRVGHGYISKSRTLGDAYKLHD